MVPEPSPAGELAAPDLAQAAVPVSLPPGHEMLGTFLSLMPDAAVAVGLDGTIVAVNERTEAFFGYSAAEVVGRPIELLVPERFRHAHRKDSAEYAADPHARPMGAGLDLYARRRNGSEFPVDISLAPIGDAGQRLVVAAVRDTTERRAAQSAQAQLAAIVQSSGDGILSMTHQGVITSWNQGAETIFGLSPASVVGHHVGALFPNDPALEELLDIARAGHVSHSRDTKWPASDGRLIDVAISVSPLALGNEHGFSVLVRDITARTAAEHQLRRQARWQTATAEVRLSLLSDGSLQASLELVCKWAAELEEARAAALVLVEASGTHIAASAGGGPETEALATWPELAELVGRVTGTGMPQEAALGPGPGLGAKAFAIPFPANTRGPSGGALVVVADAGKVRVNNEDEIIASLTASALLAFELATVRAERDRLLISADRERIARDLHDLVIQRLFGAGLRLQGVLGLIDNQQALARVTSTINDLDTTIREIREAIFALESAPGTGLKAKVLAGVDSAAEALGFKPLLSFRGQASRDVPLQVQLEAAAVLREALSNVARHARASRVEVVIVIDDDLTVIVTDNGVGTGEAERLSGIANARARAELLAGHLRVSAARGGGTIFEWRVPLSGPAPS